MICEHINERFKNKTYRRSQMLISKCTTSDEDILRNVGIRVGR